MWTRQTHKQKRSAKEKHREWTSVGEKNSEWGGQEAGGKLEDKVHSKSKEVIYNTAVL